MNVHDLAKSLEEWAPLSYQESYDNAGLIVGDGKTEVTGILVSLDCTETVVEEAVKKNCNVVVSHHPIIFGGLKKLTGSNYVERTVMKALTNNVALYAIHTNLDNIKTGVNHRIADRLDLENRRILSPKRGHLRKLVVFCPHDHVETVRTSLFNAGAGAIGDYDECSFNLRGEGTFRGLENSHAFVGEKGKRHTEPETRIEVIYPVEKQGRILSAMISAHPYEEVAHDIYALDNSDYEVGSGLIGTLSAPVDEKEFLAFLKERINTKCIRHTPFRNKSVQKIALCGGSGSFLLGAAKRAEADVFITGDFKYHEFFDAEGEILIADVGHYESEQFTIPLLIDYLREKFPTFAVHFTEVNTNPINYF